MSQITERSVSASSKGKAEGSTTYKYTATIVLALARSAVYDIGSLMANGDIFYSKFGWDPNIQTSNVDHITVGTLDDGGSSGTVWNMVYFWWPAAGPYPDMEQGTEYTITGPVAANTGTNLVYGGFPAVPFDVIDPDVWHVASFYISRAPDPGGVAVPYPAGSWTFESTSSSLSTDDQYLDQPPVLYLGTDDQLPDPGIDNYFFNASLAGVWPAYRGTTYAVLYDFNLTKFGGALPRFEALLEVNQSVRPVGRTIYEITQKSVTNIGVEVDTTDIEDIYTNGFAVLGPQQLQSTVRQLMQTYFLDAFETFSIDPITLVIRPILKFVQRKDVGALAIPYVDVGANEEGSSEYDKQEIVVTDRRDLPTGFVLDFMDAGNQYQPGSLAYSLKPANVVADTTIKISTDLVLTANEAQILARKMFWTANTNHDQIRIKLPIKYASVLPGDVISWPMSGQDPDSVRFRVNKTSKGQNGILDIEGIVEDVSGYAQSYPVVYSNPSPPSPANTSGMSFIYIFDVPSLYQGDATRFGVYTYVAIPPPPPVVYAAFPGDVASSKPTSIYKSIDNGANFTYINDQVNPGVYGLTKTVLGNANDIAWDTFNSVEIQLSNPATMFLQSAASETVASGLKNLALIGKEVVSFTTATLISAGFYRLEGLIRGRRDTIDRAGTHIIHELFILLDSPTPLHFGDLQNLDYNRPVLFAGLPGGMALGTALLYNTQTISPQAQTLQPFKPRSRWLRRDSDQSIRFYFKWRSRVIFRLFSGIPAPRTDPNHCFILEIYWLDPAAEGGDEFIRSIECCFEDDDEYWMEYTREMQAEDFHGSHRILDGTFPIKLRFEIYKKSTTLGIGRRSLGIMDGLGPLLVFF
jgi:hypothetical protein